MILRTIDALPRLRRLACGAYGVRIRSSLAQLFPLRSDIEREAILRAYLRYRLLNRAIYRGTMFLPALAAIASRAVPIVGKPAMVQASSYSGPLIIASAHFGSLYFMSFSIARTLPGRRIYLMHKKGIGDARRDEAFLRHHGIVPVAADKHGLLTLVRALREDPRTAILLAFDPPVGNRHVVPFLGTRMTVATGVGLLADVGRCPVIPWFWQYDGVRPSFIVGDPLRADLRLPVAERRIQLVEALYALLEERVARFPEQWHLEYIGAAPAALPEASLIGEDEPAATRRFNRLQRVVRR